jgi:protein SCO1/2
MQQSSFFLLVMVFSIWGCKDQDRLPFLGTHDVIQGDTVYYTIPKFYGLRDQEGKGFSFDQIKGKVFVAEFFFSRCKSICPIMTSQMARIQDEIKSKQWQGKVALLSHTVDPMYDQPEVLKSYAKTHGADFSIWTFVNADSTVYSLAQQGYLLSAFPSVDADGGFFHTDQLTLIDKNFHIRGYYDGTSTKAVDELIKDLSVLMSEED